MTPAALRSRGAAGHEDNGMKNRLICMTLVLAFAATVLEARTYMTQEQALAAAFPGAAVSRQSVFLAKGERDAARLASGVEFEDELVVRYTARKGDRVVGFAYFDAHRVRTLPETIMLVVRPDASIEKVEILSFSEPEDYLPKRRWLDQLSGKPLSEELSTKRSIRPISGATLSGRAIVNASRKLLAIHSVIQNRPQKASR